MSSLKEAVLIDDNENVRLTFLLSPEDYEKAIEDSTHAWTEDDTFSLIECYREEGVNLLLRERDITAALHRVHVKMNSILLKNNRKIITFKKCVSKVDQLKRTYKDNLDQAKQSGSAADKWPYFNVMHDIFHKEAWAKPSSTAGSNVEGNLEVAALSTGSKQPNIFDGFREGWVPEQKLKRTNDAIASMAANFAIIVGAKKKKMESTDDQKKD